MTQLSDRLIRIAREIEASNTHQTVGSFKRPGKIGDNDLPKETADSIFKIYKSIEDFDNNIMDADSKAIQSKLVSIENWIGWGKKCLEIVKKAGNVGVRAFNDFCDNLEGYHKSLTEFAQQKYNREK